MPLLIPRPKTRRWRWWPMRFVSSTEQQRIQFLDSGSILPILRACAVARVPRHGTPVHAAAIKTGLDCHTPVANSITSFYFRCGLIDSAMGVFSGSAGCKNDSVSWNVVIHGFLDGGAYFDGWRLFVEGWRSGFDPNASTLVLVVKACWKLGLERVGAGVHGLLLRGGFLGETSVGNSLLCMYGSFADVSAAEPLFEEMAVRDAVSWSAMISMYARNGNGWGGLVLFREVLAGGGGLDVDGVVMVGILRACSGIGDVGRGRMVHAQVVRRGFIPGDVFVGNSLVDMYSKCSDMGSARQVFDEMPDRNVVTWNSVLSGLVLNGRHPEALDLYGSMREGTVLADEVTVVNLLQCSKVLGHAIACRSVHAFVVRRCFGSNLVVVNSLLDAYAKCGLGGASAKIFERIEERNLVSWSTMVAGYTHCGMPDEAVRVFGCMIMADEKPNAATLLSLLEACSLLAEIRRAKSAHGVVIRYNLENELEIGTALLDMYAKCGDMESSRKVFDEMPERNVVSWSALVRAYGMNGRALEALATYHEMELNSLKPNKVTMLSILNACSHGGLVSEGLSCFQAMLSDPLLEPCQEHYSCVIDMLGRAGDLQGAMEIINMMPEGMESGASAWSALLSASRSYRDNEIGTRAAARVIELEPSNSSGYLLASTTMALGGESKEVTASMRSRMRERGVKVVGGYSLVHVDQGAHRFLARDGSHPKAKEIYSTVEHLHGCLKLEMGDPFGS